MNAGEKRRKASASEDSAWASATASTSPSRRAGSSARAAVSVIPVRMPSRWAAPEAKATRSVPFVSCTSASG